VEPPVAAGPAHPDEPEWDAEITEERPDERIPWRSTVGARNVHAVT